MSRINFLPPSPNLLGLLFADGMTDHVVLTSIHPFTKVGVFPYNGHNYNCPYAHAHIPNAMLCVVAVFSPNGLRKPKGVD